MWILEKGYALFEQHILENPGAIVIDLNE